MKTTSTLRKYYYFDGVATVVYTQNTTVKNFFPKLSLTYYAFYSHNKTEARNIIKIAKTTTTTAAPTTALAPNTAYTQQ